MNPYIGVTGFTKPVEVLETIRAFPKKSRYKLMVGVLATWKTLRDIEIHPRWAKQTPKNSVISSLFLDYPGVLNLIHYSVDPENLGSLLQDLVTIHELAGPNFHGFQLNIPWPEVSVLKEYRIAKGWDKKIVLQLGGKAVEAANFDPEVVAQRLGEYQGIIDYVLFDPSGGLGVAFDTNKALRYLSAIDVQNFGFGLGVAGGLGPRTINLIRPLAAHILDLSIDAQGRLRDTDNNLDLEVVADYIKVATRILK